MYVIEYAFKTSMCRMVWVVVVGVLIFVTYLINPVLFAFLVGCQAVDQRLRLQLRHLNELGTCDLEL